MHGGYATSARRISDVDTATAARETPGTAHAPAFHLEISAFTSVILKDLQRTSIKFFKAVVLLFEFALKIVKSGVLKAQHSTRETKTAFNWERHVNTDYS